MVNKVYQDYKGDTYFLIGAVEYENNTLVIIKDKHGNLQAITVFDFISTVEVDGEEVYMFRYLGEMNRD